MTKRQRSKASAALGQRGGLACARTQTPEGLRVRAMLMVNARRAKVQRLSDADGQGVEQHPA
jgi:hypothetical protein